MTTTHLSTAIRQLQPTEYLDVPYYRMGFLDAQMAAAELAAASTGWRPIATAPKDGTIVLIVARSGFHGTDELSEPQTMEATCFEGKWHSGDWEVFEASHWQPLPAPPQGEQR